MRNSGKVYGQVSRWNNRGRGAPRGPAEDPSRCPFNRLQALGFFHPEYLAVAWAFGLQGCSILCSFQGMNLEIPYLAARPHHYSSSSQCPCVVNTPNLKGKLKVPHFYSKTKVLVIHIDVAFYLGLHVHYTSML